MRFRHSWILAWFASALLTGGCPPRADPEQSNDALSVVAALTEAGAAAPATTAIDPAWDDMTTLSGRVQTGDYQLFDVGGSVAGDEWTVASAGSDNEAAFLVVLFNDRYELLRRDRVGGASLLRQVLRTGSPAMRVGVAPFSTGDGGAFRFEVRRQPGRPIPEPVGQVLWLNFGGTSGVSVHGRPAISFPAFDAGSLGASYVGEDAAVKAAIVQTVRDDYAAYNVTVLTSDEGPPPPAPYATVYFGGQDDRLLGLADNVDQYNTDLGQVAVIYVEGFAEYEIMELAADEMGQMVGNVASHEFGHLLGLFHTQVPTDLMDTTGSAWALAGAQSLSRATLERTVFPFGYENSPERLTEIVGPSADDGNTSLSKPLTSGTMSRKARIRALAQQELHCRCGTCLHLDD